ncbi:TonB-dependent receptor family protein [Helicobacter pylori]|uniref:TonB-dependent receptor family protein n=1 Tax=Helicobacter pylori TaxID=210 RepID=UPI002928243B|nr:TonB-dependent receptor family protein [Helicobacter pylori]MDU9769728.1 TonB-dependent receptor family protein [Helicobacter pylori]
MNGYLRVKTPYFLALSALTFLSFNSLMGAKDKHHFLKKVTTTEQKFNSSAPLSYQSEEVRNSTSSRTVISNKELKKTGNLNIENALQNVPGIQIRDATGTGVLPKISVRGFGGGGNGHSNTGMILVNGIPIYGAPYSNIELAIFPVTFQSVDRIDVIKGGTSVQYGPNTFGGVVNIITKEIPKEWENQVAERITFWGRSSNGNFVDPKEKGKPLAQTLGNQMLFNTYGRTAGMLGKHVGISMQGNWINGQGFRQNSPTKVQNYLLDAVYKINATNTFKAYYQYYQYNSYHPGTLSAQDYAYNRFINERPDNQDGGRAKRFGIVYQNYFGDPDRKVGGDFKFTYFTHDMSRDFGFSNQYQSVYMSSQNKILPFKGKGKISATNPNCGLYSYNDTNSPCWQFFDNIRRFVVNAFEPKLNLIVNTGKVKQTFNMGMRFLTEDLYRRSTTRKNPSMPNNGSGFDAGTSLNNFNNYTAVYASDEINFNNGMLTITPGLRYTFLNYEKKDAPPFKAGQTGKTIKDRYNQWNPAVNVGYKPIKELLFYFNYQRSYIPPQFSNIGNFVGTSTDYFQIFNVMEGGSRYYFNNQVSFNANYFVIFANHYFTGRYGDNKEPVNARSQGVELELYYTPIRGLNFHAAYTFIDANITSHTMVTNPANPKGPKKDIFGKKLPFVSPHQFILDASYTYAKTTIGLSSFFYSRAYSDVLNTVPFTQYAPTIKNGAIVTKTAGMTPYYWVWNLQISSTLWERKNQSVNASLQINNIFNMKYWFSGIGTSPNGKEAAPPRSITAYVSYNF